MKKRILAVLLSALILVNVTACNVAPEHEIESTVEETEQERESNTTGLAPVESEEKPPSKNNPPLTLSEYQSLVECYVTTESGKNLKNLMRKGAEQITVSHEGDGSNVFHIKTVQNDTEYQTTIQLSEGVRTPDIYSGFTSEQNGYVMIFHMEDYSISPMDDIELACVLKTADGGKTWNKTEYNDFRVSNGREYISAACFFTEKVGFFTSRYTNTDHFGPRTYWTVDGGQTWTSMPRLDIPNMLKPFGLPANFASEISDVTVVDGLYTLTVRICHGYTLDFDMEDNGERYIDIYIQYFSTDLENWTLRKETTAEAEPTWVGTIPCNGVHRTSKVQFDINQKKELVLYIEDWDGSFVVPNEDMYFVAETVFSSSVVLGEDRGALIFRDFSQQPKPIKVIQFTKGNPQVTIKDLTFQTTESYAFKYCNFIDKKTGYLFLFDESGSHNQLYIS